MKIELTYLQMTLIGMGVGLALGLVPLILGLIKGKKKLALGGLFASVAAGAVWSMLALLVMIVFIWLILRKPVSPQPIQVEAVNKNPIDVSVKNAEDFPGDRVSGD